MTLNEFIEELKKLQDNGLGEYEVRVQVVGESGVYPHTDYVGKPRVKHNKKQIIV